MEEKKKIRISLLTLLLIIAIVIIVLMGVTIYNLKMYKTTALPSQINNSNDVYGIVDNSIEDSYTIDDTSDNKTISYPNFGNKMDESKEYVFSSQEYGTNKLPFININSADAKKINNEWEKYFKENKNSMNLFEKGEDEETVLNYSYAIEYDKTILSVQISYGTIYFGTDSNPNNKYYNIDIQTGKLLSNKELFDVFSLSQEEIQQDIKNAIKQEYNRSVKLFGRNEYQDFDSYMSAVQYYYDDIYNTDIYLLGNNKLCIEGIRTPEALDWANLVIYLFNY